MPVNEHQLRQSFKRHACTKCGGDAFFDRGDELGWRCLQCGRELPSPAEEPQPDAFSLMVAPNISDPSPSGHVGPATKKDEAA